MTEFRRRVRYHQAQWREANGHPIGSQPIAPRPGGAGAARREPPPARLRPRDRRELRHRRRARRGEGPNVDHRTAPELRPPAAVGRPPVVAGAGLQPLRRPGRRPRARRPGRPHLVAGRARHGVPTSASRTRRAGSIRPYLGSLVAFDAAFVLDLGDGTQGIVGVDTKYHEREQAGDTEADAAAAVPARSPRRSGVFGPEAIDAVNGTELTVMWLEHLLVLSMLQHPSRAWSWGRLVVVHPAGNVGLSPTRAPATEISSWTSRPSPP